MRDISKIYVHCSDSIWGEIDEIRRWHLQRGFDDVGYHYLICNRFPFYSSLKDDIPDPSYNGRIQPGRDLAIDGAHVKGDNRSSIGVCLVGIDTFSDRQMTSLFRLLSSLLKEFNLSISQVWGHYEYWTKKGQEPLKSCPNLDMEELRNRYMRQEREGTGLQFNVT